MARTARRIRLQPSASATDQRPLPIPLNSPGFGADLGLIAATHLDDESVILLPSEYIYDPEDAPNATWQEKRDAGRCWKATLVYEQIGENHPHLVPYLRRDPWTAFPVLAKPSGPTLVKYLEQHKATMYSSGRVRLASRPQIYKWALHLISALAFVHAHDIVFGDLSVANCWLSAELDLSLVGFVDAGFRCASRGGSVFDGDCPLEYEPEPTKQTDLFLYGCVVYELVAGIYPEEILARQSRQAWPSLETEYMGEIVHKCWAGEYANAEEVKAGLEAWIRET